MEHWRCERIKPIAPRFHNGCDSAPVVLTGHAFGITVCVEVYRAKKPCLERDHRIGSSQELENEKEAIVETTDVTKQIPNSVPSALLDDDIVWKFENELSSEVLASILVLNFLFYSEVREIYLVLEGAKDVVRELQLVQGHFKNILWQFRFIIKGKPCLDRILWVLGVKYLVRVEH